MPLTANDLATAAGRELHEKLVTLLAPGALTLENLIGLQTWLEETELDAPCVYFLRTAIGQAIGSGRFDHAGAYPLLRDIERVLPAEDRPLAEKTRIEFFRINNPATDRQRSYAADLGIDLPDGCTKEEASELIESALDEPNHTITKRQRMVLNFWGEVPEKTWGKDEVSEWMDQMYDADPGKRDAWTRFKLENPQIDVNEDPDDIPLGVGINYMDAGNNDKMAGYGHEPPPLPRRPPTIKELTIFWVSIALIVFVVTAIIAEVNSR